MVQKLKPIDKKIIDNVVSRNNRFKDLLKLARKKPVDNNYQRDIIKIKV